MKIRQGRRNGSNLYVQICKEPGGEDLSVGYITDPRIAAWIINEIDHAPGAYRRLEAIVVEGREDWRDA